MPTYEYLCEACGYQFEKMQKMTEEKIKECPRCRQPVTRLIGRGGGFIVRGKGSTTKDILRGKTCCGQDGPCDIPPCSQSGACERP